MGKIQAQDFFDEIEKEITTESLVEYITDHFESGLNLFLSGIKTVGHERIDFVNSVRNKSINTYLIASVYIMNKEVYEIVKKEYEPRGFTVEHEPASGISLRFNIK